MTITVFDMTERWLKQSTVAKAMATWLSSLVASEEAMTITVFDIDREANDKHRKRRPLWELKAMVKALSFHRWCNTSEEELRLEAAKLVMKQKRKRK